MKKLLSLVLSIVLLTASIPVSAAGEYVFAPEDEIGSRCSPYLKETEQAIYYYDPAYKIIMYLDESDMTWYPLCTKTDCLHRVENFNGLIPESDCDGFIGDGRLLGYYNGRIYYSVRQLDISGDSYRMNLYLKSLRADGTEHRLERILKDGGQAGMDIQYKIHRGKLYITSGDVNTGVKIVDIYSLDDRSDEPEMSLEIKGTLSFAGNELCVFDTDRDTMRLDIYGLDPETGKTELLLQDLPWCSGMWFTEEEVYYYAEGTGLARVDFETGEEEILREPVDENDSLFFLHADGEFLYLNELPSDQADEQKNEMSLLILDMEGTVLEELKMSNIVRKQEEMAAKRLADPEEYPPGIEYAQSGYGAFIGAVRDYIFSTDQYFPTWYIERDEIGSETCEWKEMNIVR